MNPEIELREEPRPAKSFGDLRVWQRAMDLAVACYRVTNAFPSTEKFGLSAQLRRSSSSVAANIAEGNGRVSRKDYLRLLDIAHGSLREVETLLELSRRIGYLQESDARSLHALCRQIGPMLGRLRASLAHKPLRRPG